MATTPTGTPQLVPRAYQMEILTKAMEGNVLAALATGSGKTLIATLLVRWIASQPTKASKKIFFLVPKVPLVRQQQDFVASQTFGLRVNGFIGAMNVDLWDRAQWLKEIEKSDVLVMTPAILLRLLVHAHITMAEISLIVFDEAHHGRGNHPYAQIMRDHYEHCAADERPKIFGMTASPLWSPKNPSKDIATIEGILHTTIISVKENKAEVDHHSPQAEATIILYDASPPWTLRDSLWSELTGLGILKDFVKDGSVYDSLESRYNHTFGALGVLAADRYVDSFLGERIDAAAIGASTMTIHPEVAALRHRIQLIRQFREKHAHRFLVNIPWGVPTVSPKVWQLVKLLNKHKSDHLQAIIFAERRDDVKSLAWLLPKLETMEWVKCASIVGHGSMDLASSGMTVKEQEKIVKNFRQGEFNVLVASSVAEEGLDFQSLSLVIKFDVVQNVVSLAQSRGRARKAGSLYCVMIEADRHDNIARFQSIINSEARMMKWLSIKNDTVVNTPPDDDESEVVSEEERRARYVTSKGAVLTYSTSIALLSELCTLIPSDEFAGSLQPKYEVGFVVNLTLPSALPIPRDCLTFTGPRCKTKSEAKRAVAFMAVKFLHKLQVFDDYLLPVRESAMAEGEDADGHKVAITTVPKFLDTSSYTPFENLWKPNAQVWIHPVHIGDKFLCGLITGSELLVEFDLELTELGTVHVDRGVKLLYPSEEARLQSLREIAHYNTEGIKWGITLKTPEPLSSTAYLVPLDPNSRDPKPFWEEMDRVLEQGIPLWKRDTHIKLGPGPILARHRRGHRALLFRTVREDLTMHSAPIQTVGVCKETRYSSYAEFYRTYYDGSAHGPALEVEDDDLLLEFTELRRARTTVRPAHVVAKTQVIGERTVYHPHSVLCIIPLSLNMLRAFTAFPSLLRHIINHFRAQEAIHHLGLPPLDERRLVEALTLPLVCAGLDYQRLETLGDSCLKLATSVHIFNKFPHKHEGQLTLLRRNSISNRYLRGRAMERLLYRFVNGERVVDGKDWSPPTTNISYDEFERPLADQKLPRKAMQDCMEAILGVAWLSGGIERVLEAGTSLGLCFGGTTPWPRRYKRRDRLVSEVPPGFRGLMDTLGYHFTDVWLLVEALTHPSCQSKETWSYNRLEFLGDALVDTYAMQYAFDKFPNAPPGKLTPMRMAAVCNQTLAAIAIKELSLDRCVLHASPMLPQATELARTELENMPYRDIVTSYWKLQPPKTLGDLVESVLGAVFVDSNFDLDVAFKVVDRIFGKMMTELHPDLPMDPTSDLMVYLAKRGCHKIRFAKSESNESGLREHRLSVLIHNQELVPPVPALHKLLARQLSCERVLKAFESGEIRLEAICTCAAEARDTKDEREVRRILTKMDADTEDQYQSQDELESATEEDVSTLAVQVASMAAPVLAIGEAAEDGESGEAATEEVDGEPMTGHEDDRMDVD